MSWVMWSLLTRGLETLADGVLLCVPWVWSCFLLVLRVLYLLLSIPPVWVSITLLFALILYIYYKRTFQTFHRRGIPGPFPLPFLGNLLIVIMKGVIRADSHHIARHGRVVGTYEGHTPTLIVADVGLLKHIMIKQFYSFQDRRTGTMQGFPLRKAITSLRGRHWKHVRALLTPTFSSAKLRNMVALIEECCRTLVKNLRERVTKEEPVEVKRYCGGFTMDVIASTAFGLKIDSQNNPDDPFVEHAKKLFNFTFKPTVLMLVLLFQPITSWIMKMLDASYPKDVIDFFVSVTDKTIQQRSQTSQHQTDFLKLMIDARIEDDCLNPKDSEEVIDGPDGLWCKRGLTHEEILAQALLFFLAGYETTATTLSFASSCLATNPEIQRRLVAEIHSVLKEKDTIDIESIKQVQYLDMVICETLRLYPPAGRITRICSQDVVIEGVEIEKGTVIVIPIYAIHRDPLHWPEPDKFIPERFTPEEKAKRDPTAWMPFGMGPRQCIGIRLAMLEIKMALVHLLENFIFHKSTHDKEYFEMKKRGLLEPEQPIQVTFKLRENIHGDRKSSTSKNGLKYNGIT